MKIINVQCFNGRNIYCHRPVIKLTVDLEECYNVPTKDIKSFNDRLLNILPGLNKHCCSLGYEGGFVKRLKEGTYLAHVTEHIILELQSVAGHYVKYGKARLFKEPNLYNVICEHKNEKCVIECAYSSVEIINALINDAYIDIGKIISRIKSILFEYELGPSTKAIVDEAKKRGIPVMRIGNENLIQLGYGKYKRMLQSTITDAVSCITVDMASNKYLTKQILIENDIPVIQGDIAYNEDYAIRIFNRIGVPVVVKPYDANQGKGVILGIDDEKQLREAFKIASEYSKGVLIERYISGKDYRVLVVGNKVSAVSERRAAFVKGDGHSRIEQLVDIENSNPLRGEEHEKPLTKIKLDAAALYVLGKQGFTGKTVLEKGQVAYLRENGNLSTGGTAIDRSECIHPYNEKIAILAAQAIGLDIAGIDIVSPDISVPLYENGGAVIEVNAAPGIRMHIYPSEGTSRPVQKDIIDMLYPVGSKCSIPVISITGTNGKTTTSRMIAKILEIAGLKVGLTNSNGTYIGGKCLSKGDNTGPASAKKVLGNKEIDVAVLETARGGIIKRGLGYDLADIGVITNISEDHLGIDEINTLEDLVMVKSLVVEAVKSEGYAVLNADDKMLTKIMSGIKNKCILFSKNSDNLFVQEHIQKGEKGVYVKDNNIIIVEENKTIPVINVKDIPATFDGKVECNIENSLAAVAASFGVGISPDIIAEGLRSFTSDAQVNPGRFNLFDMGYFKVLVDYAHNIAGYKSAINAIRKISSGRLIGIVGMPGDRKDAHIEKVGEICGLEFDYIYIKEDKDLRGRKKGEVASIIKKGIIKSGMHKDNIKIIFDEIEALERATENALHDDFIIIFYEQLEPVLEHIEKMQKKINKVQLQFVKQTAG